MQFVEAVLGVVEKYRSLIDDVFNSDKVMMGALDQACQAAVNMKPKAQLHSKSSEIVSS